MSIEYFVEILKEINIAQMAIIGIMFWFFYSRLDGKISNLDTKLSGKIDAVDKKLSNRIDDVERKLSDKIDKLDLKAQDIDKRVFGIETMLHMKECCLIKDERRLPRAE